MQLHSSWIFDCDARHIWPHFFHAKMDDRRPFLFRLGIPKPMSCKVLEGSANVGNTRQCTTDLGTINQRIEMCDENETLRYRMQESTVWCGDWVDVLVDEFTLTPLGDNRTRVERKTTFKTKGHLRLLKRLGMRIALGQAHRYASTNWRRLAMARKIEADVKEIAA